MVSSYYIGINDPFPDTLVALGLQHILRDLLEKQGSPTDQIQFVDCGSYSRLDLAETIHEDTVNALNADNFIMGGLRFIQTVKNKASLPDNLSDIWIDDYETIKQQNANFYEAVRGKNSSENLPPKPRSWDVLRTINPGALPGWTSILTNWWNLRDVQAVIIGLILDMYSTFPNPVDDAQAYWKELTKEHNWGVSDSATCQQFFNPGQGKGQNRTKSDAVSVGNMKGFWLVEFLKMVGFYHDAISKTVAGGKDRKIFVIAPRNINFGDHQAILSEFKPTITSEHSIRFDILASLRYTETLIKHFVERENEIMKLMGLSIQQKLVSGFHTAFYLNLGNAVATMNVSSIALPCWVVIETKEDIPVYLTVLDELISFTRQFEEKNSDAFTLLQHLRDFISGDDIQAFFRLMTIFPTYYMGVRERGKYARQLTTATIERIITMTEKKLAPILASEGFQNIAYAIRHSTVIPQYRKAAGDRLYDIRYGLGQDLTRVARKGKGMAFISALSEFIQRYNAENARVYEVRKVQYRRNVTTDDINAIVELIDAYDAPTIARMLVAYGYARVAKDDIADNTSTES